MKAFPPPLTALILFVAALQAFGQSGIKAVDFKNFTYRPHCASDDPQAITVKNGEYSMEKQMEEYVDRLWFSIFEISYGDIDGDKQDEAIVLSVCNTGGTGNFSEGFIYKLRNGRPTLLTRIAGGDRAYGGLRTASVKNGILTVDRNDPGENGANCCPELIETQKYKFINGKLVEFGGATKRPIVPTERVSFDRGASGKSITVNLPANESRRLLVGARAGQRMVVSVSDPKAQIRLLEEAQVTEGVDNFLAVLPTTRDYTIELTNATDQPITVVLNIKIN
jgi:hypothetical protein